MRWAIGLAAAALAVGIAAAPASAAVFFVDVSAPPVPGTPIPGQVTPDFTGSGSFDPVTLHNGDFLEVTVNLGPGFDPGRGYEVFAIIGPGSETLDGGRDHFGGDFDGGLDSNSFGIEGSLWGSVPDTIVVSDVSYNLFAVPEPTEWALMFVAVGLLGAQLRRTRLARISSRPSGAVP
jgi:hypothetical protein